MRKIDKIIVHCSATIEGQDIKTRTIRDWHVLGNGWDDIGYHYVIELDGSLHVGRAEDIVGSHCKGHNSESIGICYVGGLDKNGRPKDTRTDAQKSTMLSLIKRLKAKYPSAIVYGHNDFSSKACPCFDAKEEYKNV